MKVRIHSIAELIEFIKTTDLTTDQIKTILYKGYHVLMFGDESMEDVIIFLEKYKDSETLPLFLLDLNLNK